MYSTASLTSSVTRNSCLQLKKRMSFRGCTGSSRCDTRRLHCQTFRQKRRRTRVSDCQGHGETSNDQSTPGFGCMGRSRGREDASSSNSRGVAEKGRRAEKEHTKRRAAASTGKSEKWNERNIVHKSPASFGDVDEITRVLALSMST